MWLFSGASGKGNGSPCPRGKAGTISTFVILKLGLELLSLGESNCVHIVGHSCHVGPSFPLMICWFSTQPEAERRFFSLCPDAATPMVCTPFSSVDPTLSKAMLADHSSPAAWEEGT